MNEALILLLLFAVLALPVVLNMRKRQQQLKEISEVQERVTPGASVVTTSGIHGIVTEVGENTVRIDIAPGISTTWDRRAIMRIDAEAPANPTTYDPSPGSPEA